MNQSFYTGLTGLTSSQYAIDVTSDNIANINTVGFKNSTVEFASFYGDSLDRASSSSIQSDSGLGARVQTSAVNLSQGELILGASNTELAIDGEGWFSVQGEGNPLYTRNGDFTFDASRDLVTQDRLHVLGTVGNNIKDGVLTKSLNSVALGNVNAQEPLNFPKELHYLAEATDSVSFSGNLGLEDEIVSASATVISSQDAKNALKLSFTQVKPQPELGTAWEISATITGPDGVSVVDTQTGTIRFDENGRLNNYTLPALNNDGTSIDVDLGSDFNGIISIGSQAVALSSASNGLESGELIGYTVNEDANVIASFSNGRSSSVGKVALFHFQNDQGLEKLSGSRFMESSNSGKAIFYTDKNGNNFNGSTILNYHLENSNVRTEVGLTELIIMQRSYDANSKTISTSDQMIQKALQMDA